jgi:hypothetical protein
MNMSDRGPDDSALASPREVGRRMSAYHPFDPDAALRFALAVARWAADCEMREASYGKGECGKGD